MTCGHHGLCPVCDAEYVEPCRYCNGYVDCHETDCPTQGAAHDIADEVIEEIVRLFYGEEMSNE